MSLSLRRADPADLASIMAFIRELAEYEKLAHEVTFSEERLSEELFGTSPTAWVWMAEWEDAPVGFALCFYNFSTFLGQRGIYIEDVYVQPAYRGRRIGTRLLQRVAKQACDEGCLRIDWSVLDWNAPSIALYESLGAVSRKEWISYRLTGAAPESLAAAS